MERTKPVKPKQVEPVSAWRREDQALRAWAKCVQTRARRLAVADRRGADDLAAHALSQCQRQEAHYQRSLARLRILSPVDDVRRSMAAYVADEIQTIRRDSATTARITQPPGEASGRVDLSEPVSTVSEGGG